MPDTHYVVELVAPGVVNTMPEKTLRAVADHAELRGDTVTGAYDSSRTMLAQLEQCGVSLPAITEQLEREGVDKLMKSEEELVATVQAALDESR